MAGKLFEVSRRAFFLLAVVATLLLAEKLRAEDSSPASAQPAIVQNPFAAGAPQSTTAAKPPQPPHEKRPLDRNPFAAPATAPTFNINMLPGPTSRWQPSLPALDEPSPIKTAIMSATPIEPNPMPWDELPPVQALRDRAALTGQSILTTGPFVDPPDPVRFMASPLAQPTWLLGDAQPPAAAQPIGQASFNQRDIGQPTANWSSGPGQATRAELRTAPTVVSDIEPAPESWLARAETAATAADSLDELTTVASLCQRGLAGRPSAETLKSLRQLAAWAHNRRGELLVDDDLQKDALHEFQRAISLDSGCSLAIHNRAIMLAQQNQLAAALRDFNRVLELNPGLAVAYRNRAELFTALSRMQEAVADYGQAIELLPNDAELYAARGYAWQSLGEFDRAGEDYQRAIEIDPHRPDALTRRGNLAAERGEYERALADFQQAIEVDAKCAEAHRSRAWLYATCADARYRDAQQALQAARQAAQLAPPDDYLALEALAAAHAAGGQFDEARQVQQRALAAAPPDLAVPVRQRLALYEAKRPFISSASSR